ncbi:stalk domain-containing protein [Paenibacillus sp. Soil787]|uniref:stalk domain-containing protein n=1 Tax=Paenibacillus sp. Soil787 TaxID=1736411 RepID=UPI0006F25F7B|nr:stalk domain-containing protein [Paenibacillus sp. Soil787]KRF43960.1 hypothetical protein ASG93_03340 [Paenibacillus sp. Soil787]
MSKLFKLLSIFLLVSILFQGLSTKTQAEVIQRNSYIVLVKDHSNESFAKPYVQALLSVGLRLQINWISETIDWSKVKVVIIPEEAASSLEPQLQDLLIKETNKGMNIITEGPSDFAGKLGLKINPEIINVRDVVDQMHKDTAIHWNEQLKMRVFSVYQGQTFVSDKNSGSPVISGGQIGQGKFIYLGVPLDVKDSWGIDRFPFFHEILFDYLNMQSSIKIDRLSAFIDWGYYYDQDPEILASRLKNMGIQKVFLSNWYSPDLINSFFSKFIAAAHVNGLLVYSWFELPMVSKAFWDEHPEWRQKTASGQDAHIDWRYLMALEIPECMEAVKEVIKQDLDAFDWDGVNISELYFESPNTDFLQNDVITPMSDNFRQTFKKQYGVDPQEIFTLESQNYFQKDAKLLQSYVQERIKLITKHHNELLNYISAHAWSRPLDVIITNVDTSIEKELGKEIGVDMKELLALQSKYDFDFVVEDPFTLWNKGPDRYNMMARVHNEELLSSNTLSLDINIIDRADQGNRPTMRQTGLEFTSLIAEGAKNFKQIAIYEPKASNLDNYKYASYALGSVVSSTSISPTETRINAPTSFIFDTGPKGPMYEASINGSQWPAGGTNGIMLPKGNYTLKLTPRDEDDQLWITNFNGELLNSTRTSNGLTLTYNEKHLKAVELNKMPEAVLLNGKRIEPTIYYRKGHFVIELPVGNNTVEFKGISTKVNVSIEGKIVEFTEPPVIEDGVALFPLTDLLLALKASFKWNDEFKSVEAALNGYTIWTQIQNKLARANGADIQLEVAPQIINNRTMIPIRFVGEGFHQSVEWNNDTKTIIVKHK